MRSLGHFLPEITGGAMTYEHQHSLVENSSGAAPALLSDRSAEKAESQPYGQFTNDLTGYRAYREGPEAVSITTADRGPVLTLPSGDRAVQSAGPWPLSGQNCTVLLTDVVAFTSSSRNYKDRRIIREALFDMTQGMLDGIADARSEDRGDGMLTVVWPGIPTATVIDRLLREMLPALERHNSSHGDSTRIQLRAAVDVGPVISDAMGVSGDAINVIARLVEAPLFKKSMRTGGVCLGVIVTPFVYDAVIRDDQSLTGYRRVHVKVKEFDRMAWMTVFGKSISAHSNPLTAVAC
jgi:class 3 adenylate cyclase